LTLAVGVAAASVLGISISQLRDGIAAVIN